MSKYLLLRSNKQTGPYSLEDLKEMGLKAYDLVWVEGKSAAWRYPSEIEELKPFAPIVEEQPFDRFFKKPAQINQPLFPSSAVQSTTREDRVTEPVKTASAPVAAEAKAVYSSLPQERKMQSERLPEIKAETESPQPKSPVQERVMSVPREQREQMVRPVSPRAEVPKREILWEEESFRVPPAGPHRTVSQPAVQPSRQGVTGPGFMKPFAIGFSLAACLATGVFVGLSISNREKNPPKDLSVKEDLTGPSQQAFYRPKTMPRPEGEDQTLDKKQGIQNQDGNTDPNAAAQDALAAARKKAKAKQKAIDSLKLVKTVPSVDSGAVQASTQIATATEAANLKKDLVRNNIGDYVTISGNKYSVGTFGGISELQLTVSNRSVYPLDLVVVEVQYVQSNKKIFKTENVYFRNIAAGSALMEEAPRSSRGVKVQYRITLINSKELGLAYNGM